MGQGRHEGGAEPGNLRILRARGDSMEPLVSDGDGLFVDVTRRAPGPGETAVLWDGTSLMVKRVGGGSDPDNLHANTMIASALSR